MGDMSFFGLFPKIHKCARSDSLIIL